MLLPSSDFTGEGRPILAGDKAMGLIDAASKLSYPAEYCGRMPCTVSDVRVPGRISLFVEIFRFKTLCKNLVLDD